MVVTFLKKRGMDLSPLESAVLAFTLKHLKDFYLSVQGHPMK